MKATLSQTVMHFKQAFNVLLACTFLLKAHKALLCVCCKARIVVSFFFKKKIMYIFNLSMYILEIYDAIEVLARHES